MSMEKFLNSELKTFDGIKFEVKKFLSVEEKLKKFNLFQVRTPGAVYRYQYRSGV